MGKECMTVRKFTARLCDLAGAALLFGLSSIIPAAEIGQRGPDLIGQVLTSEGRPLGDATILIFTAGPREGTSPFCPSCYIDCRKRTQSGADGAFKIEAVDSTLVFRLLVIGKNRQPIFVPGVDPFKGPVRVTLPKLARETLGSKNQLIGRVVGTRHEPLANAVVIFEMFGGDEANCGGECDGVDRAAATDENGEFLLSSAKRFDWMTVTVKAAGFAERKFFKLPSGTSYELRLTEGATVTGRVLREGQPAPDVTVGLVPVDRSDSSTGHLEAVTGQDGRFTFFNVPPYQSCVVYGVMDSLQKLGALRSKRTKIGADSTRKDVGDLDVEIGWHVAGRVLTTDLSPLPPGTRILLARDDAWDTSERELGPDGSFAFKNVPTGTISLSVNLLGYRFSEKNKSLDRINGGGICGQVFEEISGLEILLEPGHFFPPAANSPGGILERLQSGKHPLQGAEPRTL